MSAFPSFEILPDHAEYRPVAKVTLEQAVQLVTAAINHAREQQQRNLLLDLTGLTGFESPSLGRRYFFIEEWARAARAYVRVAMVTRPEMIDPQKFGITVAANNSQTFDVFASKNEALAWLRSLP